jgi:hypothetical protein
MTLSNPVLKVDTLTPGSTVIKLYAYDGTFSFDPGGTSAWSSTFRSSNWTTDIHTNVLIWEYAVIYGSNITENISLRADASSGDIIKDADFDWLGTGTLATARPRIGLTGRFYIGDDSHFIDEADTLWLTKQ